MKSSKRSDGGNANLIIAPANENSTVSCMISIFMRGRRKQFLTLGEEGWMDDILVEAKMNEWLSDSGQLQQITHQLLQVFPVFPTQASISLPYPIPTRCILGASGEENDRIVRFHYNVKGIRKGSLSDIHGIGRTVQVKVGQDVPVGCKMGQVPVRLGRKKWSATYESRRSYETTCGSGRAEAFMTTLKSIKL